MASKSEIDIEKTKKTAEQVFGMLGGALVSAMIYLGDRMGLYQALSGAGAMTSEELARKTGLHERWVREWLYGQAAANLIDYKGEGRFELSPESAMVLANENSPFFLAGGFCALPQQMAVLNLLPESFKSGMGLTYDQLGPEVNRGVERLLAPWFRTQLVPIALPKLDGVVAKLQAGAKVADVGCGAGVALIEMAKAYPRSRFPRLRYREDPARPRIGECEGGRRQEHHFSRCQRRSAPQRCEPRFHHDLRLPARYDAAGPCDAGDSQGDQARRHLANRRRSRPTDVRAKSQG